MITGFISEPHAVRLLSTYDATAVVESRPGPDQVRHEVSVVRVDDEWHMTYELYGRPELTYTVNYWTREAASRAAGSLFARLADWDRMVLRGKPG